QGTTVGGPADDPRGEGTRTAAACHSARRAVGQCQPGLSGGRHLAGPVLSLAPAAGALRAGRRVSAPASGAARPAGAIGPRDRTRAVERGGEGGDVGRAPDRGVPAAPLAAARGPQHRAAGLAPRGAGDPPAAAPGARTARPAAGQPRHVAAREPGELVCLDSFYLGQLKGVGKVWQITACDAACSYGVAWLLPVHTAEAAAHFL